MINENNDRSVHVGVPFKTQFITEIELWNQPTTPFDTTLEIKLSHRQPKGSKRRILHHRLIRHSNHTQE